jgi:hypothetical protein
MIIRQEDGLYVVEPKPIVNSDKFRQPALHFQKYGYYIAAPINTSAYLEYWREERKRCLEGLDIRIPLLLSKLLSYTSA